MVVGNWDFQHRTPPDFGAIASGLREATGLEVRFTQGGARLELLPLHVGIYEPYIQECLSSIRGFEPPHPYLWENLDRVLTGFGGVCQTDDPIYWQPKPEDATLRTRWENLPGWDRRLLSLPPFGISMRWLDRFLSGRRAFRQSREA
jgi:hypothetical protein